MSEIARQERRELDALRAEVVALRARLAALDDGCERLPAVRPRAHRSDVAPRSRTPIDTRRLGVPLLCDLYARLVILAHHGDLPSGQVPLPALCRHLGMRATIEATATLIPALLDLQELGLARVKASDFGASVEIVEIKALALTHRVR